MKSLLPFIFTYRGAFVPLVLIPATIVPYGSFPEWRFYVGLALLAAGIWFRISGVRRIGGRARVHSAGARELMTSGMFGRVRNPLYVGNILFAAGLIALVFSLMNAAISALYLLTLYTLIVLYEERVLEEQIGPRYRRYFSNVPRWIPRVRAYRDSGVSGPVVPFRAVLRHERVFLLSGALVGVLAFVTHAGVLTAWLPPDLAGDKRVAIGGVGIALLVFGALFAKIAMRLSRKRGSWLAVHRLSPDRNGQLKRKEVVSGSPRI